MNESFFIPSGDYLRQFIGNPLVKSNDIKEILKRRGTFSSSNDKKILGPLLVKTGISPKEFDELKDNIQSKEDNPKVQTRKLQWDCSESLIEVMPLDFPFDTLIDDPFGIISLSNAPAFTVAGDGSNHNHVIVELILERNDKTKNFGDSVSYHNCSIEMKLDGNHYVDLNLTMQHSSKESLSVVNRLMKNLNRYLVDQEYVTNTPAQRILFTDFDNEERINFLVKLADSQSIYLFNKDMKKMHLAPDSDIPGAIPDEIKWVEKKVKDLMLKGSALDKSVFLVKKSLKKYLKLYSISCVFEINGVDHEGTCIINFYFPDADKGKISELVMEVDNLNLKRKLPTENKADVKLQILKFLDSKKIEFYEKYASSFKSNLALTKSKVTTSKATV